MGKFPALTYHYKSHYLPRLCFDLDLDALSVCSSVCHQLHSHRKMQELIAKMLESYNAGRWKNKSSCWNFVFLKEAQRVRGVGDILAFVPVCWVNICDWENCVHSLHLSEELAFLLRRAALRVFLGGNLYLFLCAFFLRSVIFHGRRGWCTRRGHVQTNPHHIPCCGSWIQRPLRWHDCNSSPLFCTASWFAQGCDVVSAAFQGWGKNNAVEHYTDTGRNHHKVLRAVNLQWFLVLILQVSWSLLEGWTPPPLAFCFV